MKDPKKVIHQQSTQLDKTSWLRKLDNLQTLVKQVNSLADQISEIEEKKIPIIDQIAELRQQMVQECIHPVDQLIEYDTYTVCKFCEKRINLL
jgi:hypothetical protein